MSHTNPDTSRVFISVGVCQAVCDHVELGDPINVLQVRLSNCISEKNDDITLSLCGNSSKSLIMNNIVVDIVNILISVNICF